MPRLFGLLSGIALFFLLCTAGVQAQELDPYEAEVPVENQSEEARMAALPAALAQVLRKVGGGNVAQGNTQQAARLLQQYRYRRDHSSVGGTLQTRLYLIARFDRNGVQRLLDASGTAVAAPAARPQPVLWLAIDDGSGARIVSQNAAQAVLPLTSRATQRGMRVRLPGYDEQERRALSAQAIVRSEDEAVDAVSRRYGGPALIGWLRRGEGGWVADWRLREEGSEIARWSSQNAQATAVLAAGADGAADALARQQQAQPALPGTAGRYRVLVRGLESAADYARVIDTLKRQNIVRGILPGAMTGQGLELELELTAGVEGLAQLLRGTALESVSLGDAGSASVFTLTRY